MSLLSRLGLFVLLACAAGVGLAADLKEFQARGDCAIGIRYANFVTGDGDGFDVERVQGFAREKSCSIRRRPFLRRYCWWRALNRS